MSSFLVRQWGLLPGTPAPQNSSPAISAVGLFSTHTPKHTFQLRYPPDPLSWRPAQVDAKSPPLLLNLNWYDTLLCPSALWWNLGSLIITWHCQNWSQPWNIPGYLQGVFHQGKNGCSFTHTTDIGTIYSCLFLGGTHPQELPPPMEGAAPCRAAFIPLPQFGRLLLLTAMSPPHSSASFPVRGQLLSRNSQNSVHYWKPLEEMCSQALTLVSPTPIHIIDDTI